MLMTETLIIQKRIHMFTVGTWDWKEDDYKKPLIFPVSGATLHLYLDSFVPGKSQRDIIFQALFKILFSPPPPRILRGLRTSGKQSLAVAELIYGYYREMIEQFEGLIRTAGQVKYLMPDELPMTIESFFSSERFYGDEVTWFIGNERPKIFQPKVADSRRRLNPLFKRNQLIDKKKWTRIQSAIDKGEFPPEEMMELLRIRSRLEWRRKKIATIESAVFAESLLRNYTNEILVSLGISKNKLKSLRDDLSFNLMLNAVLPLTLSKSEFRKALKHIESIDILRGIRNDVVHGNIKEDNIDEHKVRNGIEGTLKIVDLIRSKLRRIHA
jgi:hypothetical protein